MNLYLISQQANADYDTYDAAVVAAETEEEARHIHPAGYPEPVPEGGANRESDYGTWTQARNVTVKLIGVSSENVKGVVLASFNAG